MVNQEERIRLLEDALSRAIPESHAWARGKLPSFSGGPEFWTEARSPLRPTIQCLKVVLRWDGDIQVEYHIAGKTGSPFEALFPLPPGEEAEVIGAVSVFVADLLAERLILADEKGFLKGGRRFVTPGSLTESGRRNFRWTTSWLGTFDWPTPDQSPYRTSGF